MSLSNWVVLVSCLVIDQSSRLNYLFLLTLKREGGRRVTQISGMMTKNDKFLSRTPQLMTPGLMWSPDPRALVILRHSERGGRGEDGAGLLALAQLLRRLSELSGSGGCQGIISHLDCSQRLLDCAGEALVRSVDAGLLVGGRTNLGQDKLIVIRVVKTTKMLNPGYT